MEGRDIEGARQRLARREELVSSLAGLERQVGFF